jgi:Uma2 family endonuclease
MPQLAEPPITRNGYPTSDGRPMAETDLHRRLMTDLIEALDDRYSSNPNVYVSGNLLLFYVRGNKRKHISPDTFVVFGVPKGPRINFLLWEENAGPGVVFEFTSSSTKNEDTRKKFALYQDVLKVPEYFMFDPYGDYLSPQFQGYRLVSGKYRPLRPKDGRIQSRQLGLMLEPDGEQLRLIDPDTGLRIPSRAETLIQAEAEVVRLRAELAALRTQPGSRNGH